MQCYIYSIASPLEKALSTSCGLTPVPTNAFVTDLKFEKRGKMEKHSDSTQNR